MSLNFLNERIKSGFSGQHHNDQFFGIELSNRNIGHDRVEVDFPAWRDDARIVGGIDNMGSTFTSYPHLFILVTGSRHYADYGAVDEAIARTVSEWILTIDLSILDTIVNQGATLQPYDGLISRHITIVHGGAAGADSISGQVAATRRYREIVFPVKQIHIQSYGKRAYYLRNKAMVDYVSTAAHVSTRFDVGRVSGSAVENEVYIDNICLAFTDQYQNRGTQMTIQLAHSAGIDVKISPNIDTKT